jgi:hypothetical protein
MVNQRIAKIAKHAIEFRGRVHPAPISMQRGNKALKISSLVAPYPTPCPGGKRQYRADKRQCPADKRQRPLANR